MFYVHIQMNYKSRESRMKGRVSYELFFQSSLPLIMFVVATRALAALSGGAANESLQRVIMTQAAFPTSWSVIVSLLSINSTTICDDDMNRRKPDYRRKLSFLEIPSKVASSSSFSLFYVAESLFATSATIKQQQLHTQFSRSINSSLKQQQHLLTHRH